MGLIFAPDGKTEWMKTHAAVPIAYPLGGDEFRVYFSARDSSNRSNVGYVKLNIYDPTEILEISHKPVLTPGDIGHFDDSGAMGSWIVFSQGEMMLYYIGWNLGVTVPFRNSLGLATSRAGDIFERAMPGPIVDRTSREPNFVGSACVILHNNRWLMWYLSCTKWTTESGVAKHWYHIKYAESLDGIEWNREGHVAIDFRDETENAISRPSVLFHDGKWKMWYSFRGEKYRIGYAESNDGKNWIRLDEEVDLQPGAVGWDSEMIEYPHVISHKGELFMFYNGNSFGQTGFGLAKLQ
jgi:predicted GH43/DUF377 family glycosyl hydrolase